jgi:hypothetical protein
MEGDIMSGRMGWGQVSTLDIDQTIKITPKK